MIEIVNFCLDNIIKNDSSRNLYGKRLMPFLISQSKRLLKNSEKLKTEECKISFIRSLIQKR